MKKEQISSWSEMSLPPRMLMGCRWYSGWQHKWMLKIISNQNHKATAVIARIISTDTYDKRGIYECSIFTTITMVLVQLIYSVCCDLIWFASYADKPMNPISSNLEPEWNKRERKMCCFCFAPVFWDLLTCAKKIIYFYTFDATDFL